MIIRILLDRALHEPTRHKGIVSGLAGRYCLLAAFSTIACPAAFCQCNVQAVASNDPAFPLQIDSVNPGALNSHLSPQVAARSVAFDVAVRNSSLKAILLYGISYEFEDPIKGNHLTRVCFSSSTFDFNKPALAPGATKTLHPSFGQPPKVNSIMIRPTVDLVFLDNGRFYGKDVCGELKQYESLLEDRRYYTDMLLNYTQANGVERTLEFLHAELSRLNSTDVVFQNSRRMTSQK